MIPINMPRVPYFEDKDGWEQYYKDKAKREKQCKKMYEVDRNPYSYVYGLVKDGTILYIGLSNKPYSRFKTHLKYKFNNDWNVSLTLLGKGCRSEMKIVEKKLIFLHKPSLNKRIVKV